jgi:chemotaxis protein MotC
MISRRGWGMLAAGALVLTWCGAVRGGGISQQPFELVRSLRALQDRIAYGDASAHSAQKAALAQIAEKMEQADDSAWAEPKNLRAAVAFVLGGGNPRVLRKLLSREKTQGVIEKFMRGALAYAEGRTAAASELFGDLDALRLDPAIAGNIALVQAELAMRKDPARALRLFDQARLLSPGTLIEEAALRRQISLFAATGVFEKFEAASAVYLRRFPKSVYAGVFKTQFVAQLVAHKVGADASKLQAMLAGLSRWDRRDLYLDLAKASLASGSLELAHLAATKASELAVANSIEARRAKLYEAAVLVVSDDLETGVATLQALSEAELDVEDADLLAAAKAIAAAIRRGPSEDETQEAVAAADTPAPKSVMAAQQAVLAADAILKGVEN